MTYRFTFYKIPFSETGVEYPLPTVGNPTESLASYKTAEQLTTAAFRENQSNIVFSEPDTTVANGILKSNYMRVGVVVAPGTIDTDENVAFYWVRDVECLGGVAIPPLNVTIAPDDIMTEFFSSTEAKISGRIKQTSQKIELNNAPLQKEPSYVPIYNEILSIDNVKPVAIGSATKSIHAGLGNELRYGVIISLTTQASELMLFFIEDLYATNDTSPKSLSETILHLSQAYELQKDNQKYANVSITGIYLFPSYWVNWQTDGVESGAIWKLICGDTVKYEITIEEFKKGGNISKSFKIQCFEENELNDIMPEDKLFLLTPCGMYEYTDDPTINPTFTIFLSISPGGVAANGPSIFLKIGNKIYDVLNDFSTSFAANDEAIKKAQEGSLVALRQISAVISSVGGVVGGVMSGNYFGAVQSVVSGVSSIAEESFRGRTPANIKVSNDAMNLIEKIHAIGYIVLKADRTISENIKNNFGYFITSKPKIEISSSNITEDYYLFDEVSAVNLEGGGQDAQATVEALFTRGVRFKSL